RAPAALADRLRPRHAVRARDRGVRSRLAPLARADLRDGHRSGDARGGLPRALTDDGEGGAGRDGAACSGVSRRPGPERAVTDRPRAIRPVVDRAAWAAAPRAEAEAATADP